MTPVIATAALFDGDGLAVVDDLEVPEPGEGEVTVRVLASGICHSDLDVVAGLTPFPVPVVLGHEGAGVIERVGRGVDQWEVGAAGALHGLTPCGDCPACRRGHPTACATAFGQGGARFRHRGRDVRAFANVASFSERTTVSTRQLLDAEGLAPTSSCLVGCAVSTGVGVVRNVGEVGPRDRVAVLGIGGIGANAIQAAREAGATVTAIDLTEERAGVAARFGAEHFVLARDTVALGAAFDVVVECSGAPSAIDSAISLTAPGGTTVLVGLPPAGHRSAFDVRALMAGRRIVGSFNGDCDPVRDLPTILDEARRGVLELDALVTAVWPLEEIDAAVAAVRAGEVLRAVLDLGDDRSLGRRTPGL